MKTLYDALGNFYHDMIFIELKQMNANLHNANITYNSLLYLDLIAYTDNCTVSYLADSLHIAKSSVTLKVGELIKLGLVQKKQSEHDRRVYYLSVNQEIAEQYKEYNKSYSYAVEQMQQTYSLEDIEKFSQMLTAFCNYNKDGIKNE